MKVEIWSDVMCPFCYIGKRKFENALSQFSGKDEVEVIWRSYQLDPELQYVPGRNIHKRLAERKGWTEEYAKRLNDQVALMAAEAGLKYNFDMAVPANTFNAHRFSHLAAKYGLQDKAEERLFAAYFTEGRNVGDYDTLVKLGEEIGLEASLTETMLDSDWYANEVRADEEEAQQIGVSGVPFFVIDRKYAVSGAQESETFLGALEEAWQESQKEGTQNSGNANVCTPEGGC